MTHTRRFAIAGAAFGAAFPVIGTAIDAAFRMGAVSTTTLLAAQRSSALLWIIDSAPLWLGLFAAFAGSRQDALATVNHQLVDAAQVKSRYVTSTLNDLFKDLRGATDSLMRMTKNETTLVQRQALGLTQASAMMHEMKETAGLASRKAASVIEIAEQAERSSLAGQDAVEASLKSIQQIRVQVDGIVEKIVALAERTLQVGEIIESVKDLADQSNVLALNAAIEATKAGEVGKGFGIVSREIRSLSDQSLHSTQRVRRILSEIQAAIRSAAAITDEGRRRMEDSMEQIRASGESLSAMMAVVRDSSSAARQIAASVTQQSSGIEQLNSAIQDLREAMEETVTGIRGSERDAAQLKEISDRISEVVRAFESPS